MVFRWQHNNQGLCTDACIVLCHKTHTTQETFLPNLKRSHVSNLKTTSSDFSSLTQNLQLGPLTSQDSLRTFSSSLRSSSCFLFFLMRSEVSSMEVTKPSFCSEQDLISLCASECVCVCVCVCVVCVWCVCGVSVCGVCVV